MKIIRQTKELNNHDYEDNCIYESRFTVELNGIEKANLLTTILEGRCYKLEQQPGIISKFSERYAEILEELACIYEGLFYTHLNKDIKYALTDAELIQLNQFVNNESVFIKEGYDWIARWF